MAKLVNRSIFSSKIREKRIPVFSSIDVQTLFGVSPVAATFLLYRYAQDGFIIRLKRGLYALSQTLPPDLFIANTLHSPSYISCEFALSYRRVIPETVYEITSVTPKATRRFETLGKVYSYRHIKKEAFTGYTIEKQREFTVLIADAEKAFVDTLYYRVLSKQKPLSRFDKGKVNPIKALQYAALFHNESLLRVLYRTLR